MQLRKNSEKFNSDGKNIFVQWDSISWENVCQCQKAINTWGVSDYCTSSRWAQSVLYKSLTLELRGRVDSQYKNLPKKFKGGVTYLYLQLRIMFYISCDATTALKKYLKIFKVKGLRMIEGENASTAEQEINAACMLLYENDVFPDETMVGILKGLTNCSVPDLQNFSIFFCRHRKLMRYNSITLIHPRRMSWRKLSRLWWRRLMRIMPYALLESGMRTTNEWI